MTPKPRLKERIESVMALIHVDKERSDVQDGARIADKLSDTSEASECIARITRMPIKMQGTKQVM